MVLEDTSSDLFFLRRALSKSGSDVELHEFHYAEDALHFLKSPERPKLDLLLVDVNMPRMTGFEFADAYAALYPELRGNAPVYILSSSLDPQDKERAEAHPSISGFLEKPVAKDAIEVLLSKHEK